MPDVENPISLPSLKDELTIKFLDHILVYCNQINSSLISGELKQYDTNFNMLKVLQVKEVVQVSLSNEYIPIKKELAEN